MPWNSTPPRSSCDLEEQVRSMFGIGEGRLLSAISAEDLWQGPWVLCFIEDASQ